MKVIGSRPRPQEQKRSKIPTPANRSANVQAAITPALEHTESHGLRADGVFGYGGSNDVTAIFVT